MATKTSTINWSGWVKVAIGIAVLIALPNFLYPVFLAKVLCFALFAAAFNLLLGFAGLLSFGHAAFFGFAAYVSAHAAKEWGFTPELAIIAGTLTATALGAVMGLLAIRRQGIYFAMVTLALAQMVFFICIQAPFTHGEDGIQGVPRGKFLGLVSLESNFAIYYFVLAVFLLGILIIYRTVHSPFGQVLKSIRENEPRAISLGYDADRYKLLAFILSAALAGMAGSTKVLGLQAGVADRRRLADVRRGGADDHARRRGHDARTDRRRLGDRDHAELSRRGRAAHPHHPGPCLHLLRAPVPPRHRRRDRPPLGQAARWRTG